ncbi:hypothetical protein ACJX0J_018165, partial [Zea mays]
TSSLSRHQMELQKLKCLLSTLLQGQLLGNHVQWLLHHFPDASAIPPEITAIVSRKYTFIVVFNNQSYRFLEKALLIKGIVASYGRMTSLPRVQEKLDVHLPPNPAKNKLITTAAQSPSTVMSRLSTADSPSVSRKLTYSPAKDKPETNPLDADKNRAPATTLESPTK